MLFRGLDSGGDWQFGAGIGSYVQGEAAIGLNIKTRLLSFVGNCFWDMLAGVNWILYFGTPGLVQQTLLSVQAVILQSYGVTKVNNATLSVNEQGSAIIQFNIYDIYSPSTPYNNSVQINSPSQG